MDKYTLSVVRRIAKKTNCPVEVTFGTVDTIVKVLAMSYSEILADEIAKLEKRAVNAYTSTGDSGDKYYEKVFSAVESILKCLRIELDYGVGLYPTFELSIDGKHYTEYSPLNALRRLNDFWNNNKR